ncbi:hypothetical protein KR074_001124, partial [Drosophila pseudoananassae]
QVWAPMALPLISLLMHLTGLLPDPVLAKMLSWDEPFEDDFVDVDFGGCIECETRYKNFVFILKSSETAEEAATSAYPYVAAIMWLLLAFLVIVQRWRQIKY